MRWWVLAIVAAGCAKDGVAPDGTGAGFPRACDQSGFDGDCVLFSGSNWGEGDVTSACETGGDIAPACPSGAHVGTCTLEGGTPNETVTTFYSPFWTAAQSSQQCQGGGGSWSAAR